MSLAAGVLTAALALPQAGLVVAYDFARVNLLNWSEDFTNTAWGKGGGSTFSGGIFTGSPSSFDKLTQTFASVAGETRTGYFVLFAPDQANVGKIVRVRLVDPSGTVSFTQYALTADPARIAVTHTFAQSGGNAFFQLQLEGGASGASRVGVVLAQLNFGPAPLPYERTTDSQLLLDRSVRLWPAPAARTNLLNWSENFSQAATWANLAGTATRTHGLPDAQGGSTATRFVFPNAGDAVTQVINVSVAPGSAWTGSIWVRTTTGDVDVRISRSGTGIYEETKIRPAPTGMWTRVSVTHTFTNAQTGVRLDFYGGGPNSTIEVCFAHLNIGPTALPYERQTDGVVYDFSLKGRNLLPNSDLAGAAGVAPIGWAASNATSISYGADGSVTFTATARFGSVFVHSSLVPVAGRPFTMSVDLTSGAGRLVPYLYDHNGTYLTVLGSTPVNGRAVLQVNRTDVYRVEFRIEDDRASGWTPITFRRPMLELGLTDGGYQASARHGTLGSSTNPDANDPTWSAAGLVFDGVDDRVIGTGLQLDSMTVLAVAASTRSNPNNAAMVSLTDAFSDMRANFVLDQSAAGYKFTVGDGAVAVQALVSDTRVGVPIFVAGSYDATTRGQKIYLDGALRSTVQGVSNPRRSAAASLYVGSYFTGKSFGGTLHYVAIYNRALTDAEVHQAYRAIRNQLSRRGVTI